MAAPKRATYIVVHCKLYMAVGGKLQHIIKGTEITLNAEQAAGLVKRGRILAIGTQKAVDLTSKKKESSEVSADK